MSATGELNDESPGALTAINGDDKKSCQNRQKSSQQDRRAEREERKKSEAHAPHRHGQISMPSAAV
jgi:hypothetical protein